MIVADVNLVAYLLITGEHTEKANAVLRCDAVWAFPYLWRSEFRNILAMHIQHRGMSAGEAELLWAQASSLARHQEYPVDPRAILEFVAQYPLTAYDAEYVTVAIQLGVPLVTFDKKLQIAAAGIALSAEAYLQRTFS